MVASGDDLYLCAVAVLPATCSSAQCHVSDVTSLTFTVGLGDGTAKTLVLGLAANAVTATTWDITVSNTGDITSATLEPTSVANAASAGSLTVCALLPYDVNIVGTPQGLTLTADMAGVVLNDGSDDTLKVGWWAGRAAHQAYYYNK